MVRSNTRLTNKSNANYNLAQPKSQLILNKIQKPHIKPKLTNKEISMKPGIKSSLT